MSPTAAILLGLWIHAAAGWNGATVHPTVAWVFTMLAAAGSLAYYIVQFSP